MIGSNSSFFHQSPKALQALRSQLFIYFDFVWLYSRNERNVYLKAYDYFCEHPDDYDGATIVKDLYHIPGLDINAMLHDYHYLVYNSASNFYTKWHTDWLYAKQMEKLGKGGASWARFIGLKITGIPFVFYAYIKRGSITKHQELEFWKDYKILMNK